jgi:hypothetical protein
MLSFILEILKVEISLDLENSILELKVIKEKIKNQLRNL